MLTASHSDRHLKHGLKASFGVSDGSVHGAVSKAITRRKKFAEPGQEIRRTWNRQHHTPMNHKRFDELKSTGLLPSPTGVGLEVLRLARTDGTSIDEIARVLQADPALTGRTLKYANTGNASSSQPITTVRDAIVRIGVRSVTGIALGFSLIGNNRGGTCRGFDYERFWSRSLAMALAGQSLARLSKKVVPDEAFLAGLLCHIGRLALASLHSEKYSEILTSAARLSNQKLLQMEQTAFATDHNELSEAMLADWGLPEFVALAVRHFENPEQDQLAEDSKERQLAQLLSAATFLGEMCVADDDRQAARFVPGFLEQIDRLGLDITEVMQSVEEIISQWQDWGRMLNVSTWPVSPFEELLAKSWEQETNPDESDDFEGLSLADDDPRDESRTHSQAQLKQRERGELRIVIADHDAATLQVLARLLASSGHEVHSTTQGCDALRLAMEISPQLLIMGSSLPDLGTLDLCRSLRSTEMGRGMYLIVLAEPQDIPRLNEVFEAGADDFLVKPLESKSLFTRIRASLRVIKLQSSLDRSSRQIEKLTSELAIASRRLEMDTLTDVLTGLPNRRYFLQRLAHDWAAARRNGQPLGCMVVDIDRFKRINDEHGHDVGDDVLKHVAGILKKAIRATDIACRYGGEEFVVVVTDGDLDNTLRGAERIRHAMETATRTLFPQLADPVTVSIGVAVKGNQTSTPESLFKLADEAMYDAKKQGRNRVCSSRTRESRQDHGVPGGMPLAPTTAAQRESA